MISKFLKLCFHKCVNLRRYAAGHLAEGIAFCTRNPEVTSAIGLYALASVVGQLFIYYTITEFDALVGLWAIFSLALLFVRQSINLTPGRVGTFLARVIIVRQTTNLTPGSDNRNTV